MSVRVRQTLPLMSLRRLGSFETVQGKAGELSGLDISPSLLFSFFTPLRVHFMLVKPKCVFLSLNQGSPSIFRCLCPFISPRQCHPQGWSSSQSAELKPHSLTTCPSQPHALLLLLPVPSAGSSIHPLPQERASQPFLTPLPPYPGLLISYYILLVFVA